MKALIIIVLSLLLIAVFARCSKIPPKPESIVATSVANVKPKESVGLEILKRHCYACHNPEASSHDALLAPPMEAVKFRYKRQYANQEKFVQAMISFVQSPSNEKALMFGAVSKFGVMPALAIPDSTLKTLSDYIYTQELEKPIWFDKHFAEQHGPNGNKGW